MLKDIKPRERKHVDMYEIRFFNGDGGFAFPCDKDGKLLPMEDCAKKNYEWCMEHPEEFEDWNEKCHWVNSYTENAEGTCVCGNRVTLWDQYYGACECEKCGRWYNLFGQELKAPQYWEEEY